MSLEGVDVTLDEWEKQNKELMEEHGREIKKLAQLTAAAQLETVAKTLLEKGECNKEDVMRMLVESRAAKEMVGKGIDPGALG